jgi:hypothetical protein
MFVSFNLRSLDILKQSRGGLARRFPARRVAGGREKVGGNGEEVEPHLMVVLAHRERAGGGGSVERGGRRWLWSGAPVLR